jgi:type I restriction enzyme S subunit
MTKVAKEIRLGDYLVELPKSLLPASHAEENGAYVFFCSSSEPKKSRTWLLGQPAILLGTGGVASVHFGSGQFGYSTDTWAIRVHESASLSQSFVFRVLEYSLPRIDYAGFEGSGLRHLRKGYIRNLRFKIPDRQHQELVFTVLDSIDAAIEKTEALIEKYQQIKTGLMHDLFTRGVLPNGQSRPPCERAPELYQETTTGCIPRDWTVSPLNSEVNPMRPIAYGILMPGYGYPGGVPVVKVKDIRERAIDIDGLLLTSPAIDHEYRRSRLREGDILFTIRGTVGRVAIVPAQLDGANITQDTARIDLVGVKNEYASLYFETPQARRFFEINTLGVAVQGINLGELRKLPLPIPSIEEQSRICARLSSILKRIAIESINREKLVAKKLGLMQDLLTGKVPVKVDTPTPEPALG